MRRLLRLLFPPRCIFCQALLPETEEAVCPDCQKKILLLPEAKQREQGAFYTCVYSALPYEGAVRSCIQRYKFSGKAAYARPLAQILYHVLPPDEFDCVAYVPTNPKNVRRRGFHHTQLLAKELGRLSGLPVEELLCKKRTTKPMFGLKPAERRANILGAVGLKQPEKSLAGQRILLVDDLITTGSTLSECARVLLEQGAASVTGATVAQAQKNSKLHIEKTN